MKVIYKKCISEKIQEAKLAANLIGKEIESIELEEDEWFEFERYLGKFYGYCFISRECRIEWMFNGIKITKEKV